MWSPLSLKSGESRTIHSTDYAHAIKTICIDAEIAKGHLKAAGIPAFILKDDGGGMLPSLQNAEGVQLVVAETQEEKARKVLQA